MLTIKVNDVENFDEKSQTFIESKGFTIELEHSLASISKWESEFEKPFLSPEPKTHDETLGYIRCMCITPDVTTKMLSRLSAEQIFQINEHINAKQSATWFTEREQPGRAKEIVTSEVIYYWMTALTIPFECDKWHFNRLLTLIKVANSKNAPQKKTGRRDMAAQRRALNSARLAQHNTSG